MTEPVSCCSPAHFKSIGQVAVTVEDSLQGVMSPPCEATEDWTKSLISLWHVHPRRHTISVAVGWLNPNTSFTPPTQREKAAEAIWLWVQEKRWHAIYGWMIYPRPLNASPASSLRCVHMPAQTCTLKTTVNCVTPELKSLLLWF